jgi:hypothetical protein
MTHDYKRHGTTTLFAALDVLAGKVIGDGNANYVNDRGYILSGPEYLTVFNGQTGAELVPLVGGGGDFWGRLSRVLAAQDEQGVGPGRGRPGRSQVGEVNGRAGADLGADAVANRRRPAAAAIYVPADTLCADAG